MLLKHARATASYIVKIINILMYVDAVCDVTWNGIFNTVKTIFFYPQMVSH